MSGNKEKEKTQRAVQAELRWEHVEPQIHGEYLF